MKICRCCDDTMKEKGRIVGRIEGKGLQSLQNNALTLLNSVFNDTMGMLVTGKDVEVKAVETPI